MNETTIDLAHHLLGCKACRRHQRGDLVARLERNGLVAS